MMPHNPDEKPQHEDIRQELRGIYEQLTVMERS